MTFEEKTLSSEYKYIGKIFKVRQDVVTSPNGTAVRDIIEHRGGVSVCAVTPENKLILIRQFRKAAEEVLWEIPAGKIEEDEVGRLQDTAERELKEETGWTATDWVYFGKFFGTCGYDNELIHIYFARTKEKGETHFDPTECIETYEVSIEDALKLLDNGEIKDGKTAIGILMTARKLGYR